MWVPAGDLGPVRGTLQELSAAVSTLQGIAARQAAAAAGAGVRPLQCPQGKPPTASAEAVQLRWRSLPGQTQVRSGQNDVSCFTMCQTSQGCLRYGCEVQTAVRGNVTGADGDSEVSLGVVIEHCALRQAGLGPGATAGRSLLLAYLQLSSPASGRTALPPRLTPNARRWDNRNV